MWAARTPAVALALVAFVGCVGSRQQEPIYPQVYTHSPGFAAGVTAAAAVIYVAGGGCKISDCPADTVCNPATERCERVECAGPSNGPDACPSGSQCEARTGTCVPF